jgi:hypothetical protein
VACTLDGLSLEWPTATAQIPSKGSPPRWLVAAGAGGIALVGAAVWALASFVFGAEPVTSPGATHSAATPTLGPTARVPAAVGAAPNDPSARKTSREPVAVESARPVPFVAPVAAANPKGAAAIATPPKVVPSSPGRLQRPLPLQKQQQQTRSPAPAAPAAPAVDLGI